MKKHIAFLLWAFLPFMASAQQAIFNRITIQSPEVNADNSVTIRYNGAKAKSVQVTGDFLENGAVANLVENKDGIWEYTSAPLAPELYSYSLIVDGLKINDPNNIAYSRDVASITNTFIISKGKGDKGDLYRVNRIPHGSVRRMWYHSSTLNMDRKLTVYTPAGYESSNKKYPVFYLLHGAGGDEEAWMTLGRTSQVLDNLIAQGKAEPMIVVMTNGNAWAEAAPGESPEGFTVPSMRATKQAMEGGFELHFPEVIAFIEKNFRTYKDKKHRAIAGLSMGSFHSENISKYYPKMFDYVGLFSGSMVGDRENTTCPVYLNFDAQMAAQFAQKPALYYIACGKTDGVMKGVTNLRKYMDDHSYPYVYLETEGGHIWRNWRIYLSDFAPRLFK